MPFKESAIEQHPRTGMWIQSELHRLDQSEDFSEFLEFKASRLASRFGITPRQLQRHFLEAFDVPPKQWLNQKRMGFAQELLIRGDPIKAVAYQLGFRQPAHFCAAFKTHFKVTPVTLAKARAVSEKAK